MPSLKMVKEEQDSDIGDLRRDDAVSARYGRESIHLLC